MPANDQLKRSLSHLARQRRARPPAMAEAQPKAEPASGAEAQSGAEPASGAEAKPMARLSVADSVARPIRVGRAGLSRPTGAKEPARPSAPESRDPSADERDHEPRDNEPRSDEPRSDEQAAPSPATVEEYLPGGELQGRHGRVYVHERLRSEIERRRSDWGHLEAPPDDEPELIALAAGGLRQVLFLDLETGGLASSPVFLAGTMHWNGEDFVLRQYFARHYGEEAALVSAVSEQARQFTTLVTFNGKSYDAPFLRARALVHGVELVLPPHHFDLLHASRRRWRDELEDCRLQTLERRVCRRYRSGDVPSDEVPGLYHEFVRYGEPYRLVPVFHHNLLDVLTMAEILRALCMGPRRAAPRMRRLRPGVQSLTFS